MHGKILLLDSKPPVRGATARHLTAAGFTVLTARTDAQARSLVDTHLFDAVLIDHPFGRPGLDEGLRFARDLRMQDPRVPLLLMTALPLEEVRDSAWASGITKLLPKPQLMPVLILHLSALIPAAANEDLPHPVPMR
ncbi:response regulator transcription factor [Corallococcus sp. Z5C101001]|uniref:response regulator transcription factor n=1 Tax=Corallococcus sp. Z5C101001 TaxID=2596829 RepID=UPI00117CD696|nr:response regulator [Corallococcus sp. Z5C101001]TSC25965.1 response regulator [Corallococcus sp. Z5C101001]